MPLDTRFALYDLTDDEARTATHIVQRAAAPATITLMPTHHIDASGQLLGFRLVMPPQTPVGAAPFTPHMFVGIGMCECVVDPVDVARLIGNAAECKARLHQLVATIDTRSANAVLAGQECIPIDVDGKCKDMSGVSVVRSNARRAVDVKVWEVERPAMLGVFHAFVRSALGERRHVVFVACEGGCYKASNEFYNMMVDLGDRATMDDAVNCEVYTIPHTHTHTHTHCIPILTDTFMCCIRRLGGYERPQAVLETASCTWRWKPLV